ncbi:MAG: hypothetical protein ABDH28_07190 [Brevinematia bacterium]
MSRINNRFYNKISTFQTLFKLSIKHSLLTVLLAFTVIILYSCGSSVKKVAIFGFFSEKEGEYVYDRNLYSYGVIKSSHSLLRYLKEYEILDPLRVNFNYGDYVSMVKNNKGMEYFITGEYRLEGENIIYKVNVHDNRGIIIWSSVIKGGTSEDELFKIADSIAIMCANAITRKDVGIGNVEFEVVGIRNREVDIMVNKQIVFSRVKDGFSSTLQVISGIEYTIEILDSNDKNPLASGSIMIGKDKKENVVIENRIVEGKEEIRIVSASLVSRRKFIFEIGSGSLGIGVFGVRYLLDKNFSLDMSIGDSIMIPQESERIYNKISLDLGMKYMFLDLWDGNLGRLGIFVKGYGSSYIDGIRNVGLGLGMSYSIWLVNLDLGLGAGVINFSRFSYGPYWKISISL